MSLRIRLALLLGLVVAVTLLVAWVLTRQRVLGPLAEEMMTEHKQHVLRVIKAVEGGQAIAELEREHNVRIRLSDRRPRFLRRAREECDRSEVEGRVVFACRIRGEPIAVRADKGWWIVRRARDSEPPVKKAGRLLLILAAIVLVLSAWVAVLVTKPIKASVQAMEHMAQGDLSHRLREAGGRELGEVARAFNTMADRIESMLVAERELMAGISHELRTPLARLRLEVEMLRDRDIPSKRLDAMEGDLGEIDQLIGELLELSRLRVGQRSSDQRKTDLQEVADAAVAKARLGDREISVSGEACPILGDLELLVRVVSNLLQNAHKYSPAGTAIELRIDGNVLAVRDFGPGVPEAELSKLFESFYRAPQAVSKGSSATGYGLGLAIAREIITMHDGTISASLPEGGGLEVRFEIPRVETSAAA